MPVDSFIQPPANSGSGPKVDASEVTIAPNTANADLRERQRINIADASCPGELAIVQDKELFVRNQDVYAILQEILIELKEFKELLLCTLR